MGRGPPQETAKDGCLLKKVIVVVLVILVVFPLFLGGLVWYTYNNTAESSIPMAKLTVLETQLEPAGYEWHTPVFGGMMYKDFYAPPPPEIPDLGSITAPSLSLQAPVGLSSTASLSLDGKVVWSGSAENIQDYIFLDSGFYELRVDSRRELESGKGYGSLQYRATFTAVVDVRLEQSAEEIAQGDVLAVRLYNLPAGAAPAVSSNLGTVRFAQNTPGRMTAYIAAAHDTQPGAYNLHVELDGRGWDLPFTVVEAEFPRQDLEIDTGTEEITEANSAAAYQEYNSTIPPLFEQADETVYWQGRFIWPVEGELNTEYGLYRYTNGAATPSRHPAIDIGAAKGAPVVAPNAGRVLFADKLLNTGNTVVIEHGDGLKSLFYHMDSLKVQPGDMVEKGQQIGTVGNTGYSTGPHLHYEVRLFENSVDPLRLFDGRSGLYAFESPEAEEPQQAAGQAEAAGESAPEPEAAPSSTA